MFCSVIVSTNQVRNDHLNANMVQKFLGIYLFRSNCWRTTSHYSECMVSARWCTITSRKTSNWLVRCTFRKQMDWSKGSNPLDIRYESFGLYLEKHVAACMSSRSCYTSAVICEACIQVAGGHFEHFCNLKTGIFMLSRYELNRVLQP